MSFHLQSSETYHTYMHHTSPSTPHVCRHYRPHCHLQPNNPPTADTPSSRKRTQIGTTRHHHHVTTGAATPPLKWIRDRSTTIAASSRLPRCLEKICVDKPTRKGVRAQSKWQSWYGWKKARWCLNLKHHHHPNPPHVVTVPAATTLKPAPPPLPPAAKEFLESHNKATTKVGVEQL